MAKAKTNAKAKRKSPPKTARKTVKGGRASGSRNFGLDKLHFMLDYLEKILPIGPDEWEQVMQHHNHAYPKPGRDVYAIRRKYMTLQRKTIPTGDPTCPPEVKQAKRIKYKLGQKADLGDATEPFDLENGFEDSSLLGQDSGDSDSDDDNLDDDDDNDIGDNPPSLATASGRSKSTQTSVSKPKPRQVRPYNKSVKEELLETMQISALQKEKERKSRLASHNTMIEAATAFGSIIAAALVGRKKKKKKKSKQDAPIEIEISSDSSSDLDSDCD